MRDLLRFRKRHAQRGVRIDRGREQLVVALQYHRTVRHIDHRFVVERIHLVAQRPPYETGYRTLFDVGDVFHAQHDLGVFRFQCGGYGGGEWVGYVAVDVTVVESSGVA